MSTKWFLASVVVLVVLPFIILGCAVTPAPAEPALQATEPAAPAEATAAPAEGNRSPGRSSGRG